MLSASARALSCSPRFMFNVYLLVRLWQGLNYFFHSFTSYARHSVVNCPLAAVGGGNNTQADAVPEPFNGYQTDKLGACRFEWLF
ncbi:hypothetical protein RSAG8_08682, partial [Rhizoctonia solani AG-8 WAC10335]